MSQNKPTPATTGLMRRFKCPHCGATMSIGEWRTFDAATNPPCRKCGIEMKALVRRAGA